MSPLEIPWPETPVVVALISVSGIALGAWLTWLASGAGRLQQRVDALERRTDALEDDVRAKEAIIRLMASFIDRLGQWLEGGMRGKRPQPDPKVHEYIDTEPWLTEQPNPNPR